MAIQNLNAVIRARVEAFSQELVELVREATLEVVQSAIHGSDGLRHGLGRGRGAADVSAGGRSRRKGAKRDPEELTQLADSLLAYVKANPGQRIEEVARGMETSTRELSLPAKKLLANRKIRTRGQKRATTYFPR